jgi:hypothetical protein
MFHRTEKEGVRGVAGRAREDAERRVVVSLLSRLAILKEHAGFMKYFKNTSWLFAEKILRMAVGLFVGIWVARYLGPDKFGLLSYAQSFVGLFSAIATLGLNGIVVREIVKYPEEEDGILGTAFILKMTGNVVVPAKPASSTTTKSTKQNKPSSVKKAAKANGGAPVKKNTVH